MKKDEFESAVLDLWVTTSIPLTVANLQYHTKEPRRKVCKWLDALVIEGTLDMDSDDSGEAVYTVPGADRPISGPRTFAEAERLAAARQAAGLGSAKAVRTRAKNAGGSRSERPQGGIDSDVDALRALVKYHPQGRPSAKSLMTMARGDLTRTPGQKSLLLSGGLSFLLGPLGWLYAGSFREAVPASAAALLAYALIPTMLLIPILGIAMPLSGIAGLIYAWQYNQSGKRRTIVGKDDEE